MKLGSLFSGIGGLELGLEAAFNGELETVWQVERELFCRGILARHWPDAVRYDDVCAVGAHNLEPVDVICGGFPCQDISLAGLGAGLAGARSGLWREYLRIVRELRPSYVVIENVAALVGRGLGTVLGDLAACGYDALWFAVRASDVGAPHRRERLFIVGYAASGDRAEPSAHVRPGARESRGASRGGGVGRGDVHGRDDAHGDHAPEASELADTECRGCEVGTDAGVTGDRVGEAGASRFAQTGDVAGCAVLAHPDDAGPQGRGLSRCGRGDECATGPRDGARTGGTSRGVEPGVGRESHGIPCGLDRWPAGPGEAQHGWEAPRVAKGIPHRSARLKALGNAVVPAVAYVVGCVVRALMVAA